MTELISLADEPIIPSSMNPIYTGPSVPLSFPAAGLRAILRRTKSMNHQDSFHRKLFQEFGATVSADQGEDDDRGRRGKTSSPVRANSKRRRSVASISRSRIGTPYLRGVSRRTDSPPSRPGSVELGLDDYRDVPSPGVFWPRAQSRAILNERSPSRGRAQRRDDTPHLGYYGRTNSVQDNKRINVARPLRHTHSRNPPLEQAEHLSRSNTNSPTNHVSPYITKGAFRLYNHRDPELFRFPKSRSQPDPTWRIGDGFSDDEARPGFRFITTTRHKRKRSRSLSALGQLSVEAEIIGNNVGRVTRGDSRRSQLNNLQGNGRSAGEKELWPTREEFEETTIRQKPKKVIAENRHPTPAPSSQLADMSKSDMKRTVPLKRMASGFANLGKRIRRSQSPHGKSMSPYHMSYLPKHGYQLDDDEYGEGEDSMCERMEYESESEQDSDASEHIQMSAELLGIESSSKEPDEDNSDDLDEDMQDTVLDSQMDEVPSSSFDLGQGSIRTAHAISMAKWESALLSAGIDC